MVERYKQHVIDQALTLLKAHDNIQCMFTTPKLLEALCEKVSLKKLGITGVFCGGTEMTPQFHRFAVEELLGRRLLRADLRQHADGPRGHAQAARARRQLRHHLLPAVAARDDRSRRPGQPEPRSSTTAQTGRVRLTTLTQEFFMPRFLERDECEREPPCEQYPWDGVRNVRPFIKLASKAVVEGVY